jgi:hypothetical protein
MVNSVWSMVGYLTMNAGANRRSHWRDLAFTVAMLCGLANKAHAEPTVEDKPWARGVSADDQRAALGAFQQGNEYFAERRYSQALQHYRKAVGFWEHPAIHFNMAVCLIHMDEPIEAFEHINKALVYDAAPMGEELYAQGLTYQKLLNDRLGHLTVSTQQPKAEVTLDGQVLFTGPSSATRVLMPGRHQIVATLSGFVTHTQSVELTAGKPLDIAVRMVRIEDATELERPIATWVPWVTMGGGALVGLAGLGVRALASAKLDAYDSGVAAACPHGCVPDALPSSVRSEKQTGHTLDAVALATMGVGAAGVLTGIALLVMNQPRPVERPAHTAGLHVAPYIGAGAALLGVTLAATL